MVDVHLKEPIFVTACYNGSAKLWNYQTCELIKSFECSKGVPTRCARFIPPLNCIICGSDDTQLRVFNYHTMECIKAFRAHDDYVRSIAVHDHLPIVLSCSDSGSIREWNWSENWALAYSYEAHTTYCMDVAINPSNSNVFASASLDSTICVWTLHISEPNFELRGHKEGVTCLQYYPHGDKPYLLSGSDDGTARLWDYQTKACLYSFSVGENNNVTAVQFSPDVPYFFVMSQRGVIDVISVDNFEVVSDNKMYAPYSSSTCNGWTLAAKARTNLLIAGYDTGVTIFKLKSSKPVYSMDANGKVVLTDRNQLQRMDLKSVLTSPSLEKLEDGEIITDVSIRDLAANLSLRGLPTEISYNKNGQFIAVVSAEAFTIISSLSLRQKASDNDCCSFAWGPDSNSYAVLKRNGKVTIYRSFTNPSTTTITPPQFGARALCTGSLLVVCGPNFLEAYFYDWTTGALIRQINEEVLQAQWSPSGGRVALATPTSIFILDYHQQQVQEYLSHHPVVPPNGLDFAFDVTDEIEEQAQEMIWIGEQCLVFSNEKKRLNYFIGGETTTLGILRPNEHLLGYLPKVNRIFCIDVDKNIYTYLFQYSVAAYMAAVVREDFEEADNMLSTIPVSSHDKVAKFLQGRGQLQRAYDLCTDDDQKFQLALELKKLDAVHDLLKKSSTASSSSSLLVKWKQMADLALELGEIDHAIEGYRSSGDMNSLLLLFSSTRDKNAISSLGDEALCLGKANIAFTCFHLVQRYAECTHLLILTGKSPEAAFYARTYSPHLVDEAVKRWKESSFLPPHIREAIASPATYPNLFPMLSTSPPQSPPSIKESILTSSMENEDEESEDVLEEEWEEHEPQAC